MTVTVKTLKISECVHVVLSGRVSSKSRVCTCGQGLATTI